MTVFEEKYTVMKKVIEVFAEPISNGGQESFVMNVLQKMDMTDLQIDLCTPYYCDNTGYRKFIEEHGGRVYCAKNSFRPGKSRFYYLKLFHSFFSDHFYDVAHIHSGSITALGYIAYAAKQAGIKKIIVHSHSTGIKRDLKYHLIKMYGAFFMSSATAFFACSKAAGEWKYTKQICNTKLRIINNGIDLDKFSYDENTRNKIRNGLGILEDEILIGHVGRFSYEKNQKLLIEIMDRLNKHNEKVKLLLIGSGENEGELRDLIDEYNLNGKVLMTGNVNNVNDYMCAMDVFAFPSIFEGMPIVAIEAQASGLFLLASRCVTREIQLTKEVMFLSLDDINLWMNCILKYGSHNNIDRNNRKSILKDKGYDVNDTAAVLRKEYLD